MMYAILNTSDNSIIREINLPYRWTDGRQRLITFDQVGQTLTHNGVTYRVINAEQSPVTPPNGQHHAGAYTPWVYDAANDRATRDPIYVADPPPPSTDELADQLNDLQGQTGLTELALRALISLISDQIFSNDPDPVSRDQKAKAAVRNRMKAVAEGTRG